MSGEQDKAVFDYIAAVKIGGRLLEKQLNQVKFFFN